MDDGKLFLYDKRLILCCMSSDASLVRSWWPRNIKDLWKRLYSRLVTLFAAQKTCCGLSMKGLSKLNNWGAKSHHLAFFVKCCLLWRLWKKCKHFIYERGWNEFITQGKTCVKKSALSQSHLIVVYLNNSIQGILTFQMRFHWEMASPWVARKVLWDKLKSDLCDLCMKSSISKLWRSLKPSHWIWMNCSKDCVIWLHQKTIAIHKKCPDQPITIL